MLFRSTERSVERVAERTVATAHGEFRLLAYQDHTHRDVHLALVRGDIDGATPPLVRVHLAETLRDLVGVREIPARWTLDAALARVAREGHGVVVILREQESPRELADAVRGAGQATAAMTATTESSEPAVAPVWRTYGIGAQILQDLGVRRMRVLSSPKQMQGLSAFDLEVLEYIGPADAPGDVDAR